MKWSSPDNFESLVWQKKLEFKYDDKESIYDELEKNWAQSVFKLDEGEY